MEVDKIDDLIRNKINEVKVPEKFSNMLKYSIDKCQERKRIRIYKYVAFFILVLLIGMVSLLVINKNSYINMNAKMIDNNSDISENLGNNNEVENEETTNENYDMVIDQGLACRAPYRDALGNVITSEEYTDCILLIKINELNSGVYYYPNSDDLVAYPFTFATATVEKVYKGEKSIGEEIKLRKDGAIISYKDYEKTLLPIQIEKRGISKMSDEEKSNRYVKVIDSFTKSEINKNKEYLVYLKYDEQYFNCYKVVSCEEGFREYDKITGLFKNNKTSEFEELNIKIN